MIEEARVSFRGLLVHRSSLCMPTWHPRKNAMQIQARRALWVSPCHLAPSLVFAQAHRDGPLYESLVAILSLGSECLFEFCSDDLQRRPLLTLRLPPRSLLLFRSARRHTALRYSCRIEPCQMPMPSHTATSSHLQTHSHSAPCTRPQHSWPLCTQCTPILI